MVRLRTDVDGCGCFRCQDIEIGTLRSSVAGAFSWACTLPMARPSILVVFGAVGLVQLVASAGPERVGIAGALLGVTGAFAARGYVGIVARDELGDRQVTPGNALGRVLRRLPAFLGAGLLIVMSLAVLVLAVRLVAAPVLGTGLRHFGIRPLAADLLLLVFLAVAILYALVRLCFVPEACFVGGYGPVASLRVSLTLTDLRLRKAGVLVVGYGLLLAAGVLLDFSVAGADQPLLLTVYYHDTTVVIRSFGLSLASGVRLGFDLFVTVVFSGVFVHQYTNGVFRW